jgi:hypothetical protein
LNYRKIFLHDTKNIFETVKKPIPVRHDTATHIGPTAFGGLSNAAAVAMASALTRSQPCRVAYEKEHLNQRV